MQTSKLVVLVCEWDDHFLNVVFQVCITDVINKTHIILAMTTTQNQSTPNQLQKKISDVIQIKKAVMIIEDARTDIQISGQKYPDLLLCPDCYSTEISIAKKSNVSRCRCLDCGKNWFVEIKDHPTIKRSQFWSVA